MSDEYPLELIAGIAARLLHGEDYASATRRALALLDQCRATIAAHTLDKKREMEDKKLRE